MNNDKKDLRISPSVGFEVLTDESPMPYGNAHKGKKMIDVPAAYLLWLHDNNKCSKSVQAYITDNWDVLHKQANRNPKRSATGEPEVKTSLPHAFSPIRHTGRKY